MIRTLIYLTLFATGFLVGGVFPSFSVQYQQRVLAQYEQITTDLTPFQKIANRHHDGSMDALIEHHLKSSDPTFYDEGIAIQMMVTNHAELAATAASLEGPAFDQVVYLVQQGDLEIARATWDVYTPTLITSEQAIMFAILVGLAFCAVTWFLSASFGSLFGQSRT
jgi:hypothetical protein